MKESERESRYQKVPTREIIKDNENNYDEQTSRNKVKLHSLTNFTVYEEPVKMGYGYRHQQTVLLFFCYMAAFSLRSFMGVALVAMMHGHHDDRTTSNITNSTNLEAENKTEIGNVGVFNGIFFHEPFPTLQWDKKAQDYILASFGLGYVILQIPAGQIVHRFGTRYLLTSALVINGLISFFTPWAAYHGGWIYVMVLRIIQGLGQSCFVAGMHRAFGKWAPLEERSQLTAFAYGGQPLGTVVGLLLTGYLAASPVGWPGVFRFYGLLSLSVAIIFWLFGADSPGQHPRISVAERQYIEEALKNSGAKKRKHLKVPWKKLLCCRGMIAVAIAHIGQGWFQITMYSEIPSFMDKVMKVDIKTNGLLTALPFFVMWLTNFFFSWFIDMIIVKKWLSVINARKLAQTIGTIPTMLGLFSLAYVKKDIIVVETILILTCAFETAVFSGFFVNIIDLAPNFAGTMISISNFITNVFASVAPVIAGLVLNKDVTSQHLWGNLFFIVGGIYLVTYLVYLSIGSAEVQKWNDPEEETRRNIETGEENPMLHTT
ncbi:putative inorganic phosphate cotransporter isoform X1 [Cydia pomonella]|uniref:putative inorganic phosphate cotransporter isoform X1 n=1 Tax=Cydia pomonella TaxID=82600 RepID=UPI002ADE9275|nr:putative inorganic phosphate cotransporter isoform X1 [Cydia pomonella]